MKVNWLLYISLLLWSHDRTTNFDSKWKISNLLKREEQRACDDYEDDSEVEDTIIPGHYDPSVAEELVPSRKNFPPSFGHDRGIVSWHGLSNFSLQPRQRSVRFAIGTRSRL